MNFKPIAAALLCGACATMLMGCSDKFSPSDEHCKASYIKEVADKEGLDKAKALTNDCLAKGYDNARGAIEKGADALRDKLFGEKK